MIEVRITGETKRDIAKEVEVLYAAFCTAAAAPVTIDMGDAGEETPAPAKKAPAKKKAAPKKEPEPEAEPETEEAEDTAEYTLDDVRAAVTKGVAAIGPDKVKALFADFDAKSGKDLADDKRGNFIEAVNTAIDAT